MRTLRNLVLSAAAGAFLIYCPISVRAQPPHEPTELEHRFARHFPERPPASFEFAEGADHRPLIIITNLHQFALIAYVVQTEPKSANDRSQTLFHDGLTRMGGRTIMHKMQHVVQHDPSAGRLAQILLKNFEQSRDALRKALGGPTTFGDQAPNR